VIGGVSFEVMENDKIVCEGSQCKTQEITNNNYQSFLILLSLGGGGYFFV
jgi:hypothetical protein